MTIRERIRAVLADGEGRTAAQIAKEARVLYASACAVLYIMRDKQEAQIEGWIPGKKGYACHRWVAMPRKDKTA